MPPKPVALLFDVNGTLFPASAAAGAFRDVGLPSSAVELWFSRVLRDAFAAQLAGSFVPFKLFAVHHLSCLLEAHPPQSGGSRVCAEDAMSHVQAAWSAADVYPDANRAVRAMHAAGLKLAALTNGSAEAIAKPVLQKAGLEGCFAHLLDINMAQAWKPARQSYAWAAQQMGLAPEQVMMVASHPWDCFGAMQAGLQAAYVQRDGWDGYPTFLGLQPQLVVRDFEQLAARLC